MAKSKPLQVLHLTDCHLEANLTASQENLSIQASLNQVLAHAQQHPTAPPDLVLVTGDLAHAANTDDFRSCYQRLLRQLKSQFDVPVYAIPGNHDHNAILAETFGQHKAVQLNEHWQLVLLNSTRPDWERGYLNETTLAELEQGLTSGKHQLIAIHHQLINLAGEHDDQQMVTNPEAFFAIAAAAGKHLTVAAGHAHRSYDTQVDRVRLLGTPATCPRQYQSVKGRYQIDPELRPGFRWLTLHEDGQVATRVYHL